MNNSLLKRLRYESRSRFSIVKNSNAGVGYIYSLYEISWGYNKLQDFPIPRYAKITEVSSKEECEEHYKYFENWQLKHDIEQFKKSRNFKLRKLNKRINKVNKYINRVILNNK